MQTCACYVGFGHKAITCKGETSAESTIGRAEWAVGEARLKPAPGSSDYFQTVFAMRIIVSYFANTSHNL